MPHRVIQWSSGNVGKGVLRAIAERDTMELVGFYVTSNEKVGEDAGRIAGIPPTGVVATNDIDEIVGLDADVVIHTSLPSLVYGDDPDADVQNICTLLASGKNVITTVGYMYPKAHGNRSDRQAGSCMPGRGHHLSFHRTQSRLAR